MEHLKKLQQFYILKFTSTRLKRANFDINVTFKEAKRNAEVISINNSELIRTLFRYQKREFNQNELNDLLRERKILKRRESNEENRKELFRVNKRIESILFIEDLVTIEFDSKNHYREIVDNNGFYVNGTRFTPFMASAGMIRRNTALFINNNLKHPIMDILDCGRNESMPMVAAKFGAYFSLYSSSTFPVSFPKFAVIPDKEMETLRRVSLIKYAGVGVDDEVEELDQYPMQCNMWDGQGLISPRLAEQWSQELDMDYTFSAAVIRAPYLKGLVAVFDIHQFAQEVAGRFEFTDFYGNTQNINDVDMIVSESMFKLVKAYESTEDYIKKCHENKLGFSIAKVNQKEEKSYSRTSYQFLQVLRLSDADIAELCRPTVDWFRNLTGAGADEMVLYATGEGNVTPDKFRHMDAYVKALVINPYLVYDKYIQTRFNRSLNKKKRDSYMGSVLINANYQFMISDPYLQACHIFGLDKEPLLKEHEHYCKYWIDKGVERVAAVRSPIVHHSEVGILNMQDREDVKKWYKHIYSGVVYPANGIGVDCAIHGGADFDGDLICTIDNYIFEKGRIKDVPIVYESQKSERSIVDARNDREQVEIQLNGHDSKVGFATNISSSFYTLLEEFPVNSKEYEILQNRLKIGRAIQGEIIDGVKGLKVPPFREHWTKAIKITDDMTEEEKERAELYNRVVCYVRPAYFRFLYPHYMRKYNKEIRAYDIACKQRFRCSFESVYKAEAITDKQAEIIRAYRERSSFLDNESTVNRISYYMRQKTNLTRKYTRSLAETYDHTVLMSDNYIPEKWKIERMKEYIHEFKTFKRNIYHNVDMGFKNLDEFVIYLRNEMFFNISSNEEELTNYAVDATYGKNGDKSAVDFPWVMFSNGILNNLIVKSEGTIRLPVRDDENGDVEYLWRKYRFDEYPISYLYSKQDNNLGDEECEVDVIGEDLDDSEDGYSGYE